MTRAEGIAEMIADTLSEHGIYLIGDTVLKLSEAIDEGVQCWNEMSYGHIPHPLEGEIRVEQGRTKAAISEHDRDADKWRKDREELAREIRALRWKLDDARQQGFRG